MSKTLKILSRPNCNAEEYGRWSVRDLLGTDFEAKIDEYSHSVGKDWSMFK